MVLDGQRRRRATAKWSSTFAVRDTGIGLSRRGHRPSLPVVLAGRLVDDAQVRRHGPRAGDQQAPGRADGRHDVGRERRPGHGSTFFFTIRAPLAELPPTAGATSSARSRRSPASGCSSSTTTRPIGKVLTLQTAKWGMVPRDTESPARRCAGSSRAKPSTSRSSTCTCRRWTASRSRGGSARADPTLPLVLFSSLGRREAGDAEALFAAYLAKPLRQSQLFDTLVSAARAATPRRGTAAPAKTSSTPGMAARHPLRILLAEDNVVNQKLAMRLLQQMGYRADLASNGIEAVESVRAPDLRRRADGRADARDGRARGHAADHRALAATRARRASWR